MKTSREPARIGEPPKNQKEFWIEGKWYYGQNHVLHWQIPEHHFYITAGSLQLTQSLANSHSNARAVSCFSDRPCFIIVNTKGKKTKETKNELFETHLYDTTYTDSYGTSWDNTFFDD